MGQVDEGQAQVVGVVEPFGDHHGLTRERDAGGQVAAERRRHPERVEGPPFLLPGTGRAGDVGPGEGALRDVEAHQELRPELPSRDGAPEGRRAAAVPVPQPHRALVANLTRPNPVFRTVRLADIGGDLGAIVARP